MGVIVTKYTTLPNRYAGYNNDENFIQPHIIRMMIFDELKLPKIEEFVNGASITITEAEIEEFLNEKMDEEQPGLKAMYEMEMKITDGEVDKEKRWEAMKSLNGSPRYYFEPYSLQYFKIYTSRLRGKLQSLFSVLNDIEKCEELSEESKSRLKDLDFHINSKGNLYFKDAERLADAIIYNVNDLRRIVQAGNNPETYLVFKKPDCRLGDNEIYPSEKIQIKDRYYARMSEFIALSEDQQTQVQKEELENSSRWMKRDFEEDKEKIFGKNPKLVKAMKNTEE